MLRLSSSYFSRPILSLRTGGKIGLANQPIINPNNLKIEGWFVKNSLQKGEFILPVSEVRDFISKGLVVNDFDALTHPEDMIRLEPTIKIRFQLIGKPVVTEKKRRLGKVADFAVNEGFYIQKLYINPSFLKGITSEQLIISRNLIVEMTDKKIIVSDAEEKVPSGSALPVEA